ncbi:RecB family exonuclease [Dermacoccaceae bacterium W4C1]
METIGEASPTGPRPALSPSRAADFMQCPLLYRFRVIDRLPAPPSAAAARGTLVHSALERIFDLPAHRRTPAETVELLPQAWRDLVSSRPELGPLAQDDEAAWLAQAAALVRTWFDLEDPSRLEPQGREQYIEADLDGVLLRGYVDRLDVAPTGETRVVDYKTGRSPSETFEAKALFQMKFYALVLARSTGTTPRMLQLVYLGNGEIVRYTPDEHDLRATERKVSALWEAIRSAAESGDWRPRRSRMCSWCDFKEHCPEFGGTPPPLPADSAGRAVDPRWSAPSLGTAS